MKIHALLCGPFLLAALSFVQTHIANATRCESPEPGDLVINEVLFHFGEAGLEFVELYNRSACAFTLSDLTLSDSRDTREPLQAGTVVSPPGAYTVLASNLDAFRAAFPGAEAFAVARWPALNNTSDAVVLRAGELVVDSLYYSSTWGTPGRSIEKRNPELLIHTAANWGASTHAAGATPGERNSLFVNDEEGPAVEYVEQETPRVLFLQLNEEPDVATLSPVQFAASGVSPIRVDPGPDALSLRLIFGDALDAHFLHVEGLTDLTGNAAASQIVPIAGLAQPGDLILNEIMYDPRLDPPGTQPEYVEIYNRSGVLRTLRGLILAEEPGVDGARPGTIVTSERVALEPDQYAVVYAAAGPLHFGPEPPAAFIAFGSDAGYGARWLRVSAVTPRGLANSGQTVALVAASGEVLDEVRYASNLHSLTLRELGETRGTALERRIWSPGSDESVVWTSSHSSSGGTPGALNAASASESFSEDALPHPLHVTPSPFSPDDDGHDDVAIVQYRLRQPASAVRLLVFDMDGRLIRQLLPGSYSGRMGSAIWDGRDESMRKLRTGVYVVVLEELNAEAGFHHRDHALVTLVRP